MRNVWDARSLARSSESDTRIARYGSSILLWLAVRHIFPTTSVPWLCQSHQARDTLRDVGAVSGTKLG
jgi:hypothetical protein